MSIDYKSHYILNPEYVIRNDKNRIILASKKDANHSVCTFVHPVWAFVLSYFDGKMPLNKTIKTISTAMHIPEYDIMQKIECLIENKKRFKIKYDNHRFWFPEYIIVKNDKKEERTDLDKKSFMINPPYDFTTIRLNAPLSIMLVLNTNCVTDCIYCYADKSTKHAQMSLDKVLNLIDEAYDSGIKSFDLSGGEIFTFKGWDRILEKVYEKGYNPYLSTKVPLTEQEIDRLYETGARTIQISLDSLDPQLLKETLKVSLDYSERIKNTILYLSKKGFSIIIKSVLTRATCTIENFKQLVKFMKEIPNIQQYTYTPVGYSHYKSVEDFNAFKPTMNQILEMDEYFEHLRQDTLPFLLRPDTGAVSDGTECCNKHLFYGRAICSGNVYEMVVLPDGQVTICEEMYWNPHFIIGDITKNSLLEVWQSDKAVSLWKLDQKKFPKESACRTCDEFEDCRYNEGVCWKELMAHYGKENWLYPDSRCPKAPKPLQPVFYDNSFIAESIN